MAIRDRENSLAPIGYWSPVGMLQEMERMLNDFRLGFDESHLLPTGPRLPAVDIRDEGDHYAVEAELPGMRKDEVAIEIGEEALIIKAEKESRSEQKEEGYVRQERGRSSFYRQIALPAEVDHSRATAKLEDGLLRIVLPKKTEKQEGRKKLEIQ